jgi:serine/threonine protein kinase
MYQERLDTLGNGAFACVKAVRVESKVYALKIYNRKTAGSRSKFVLNEKLVMQRLIDNGSKGNSKISPYIVKLVETNKDSDSLYFLMEAVLGGPLHKHISQRGADYITPQLALKYCAEVLSGLLYIGRKGCIHRDIKVSNCLLTENGHVKICDFGSARCLFDEAAWPSVSAGGALRSPRATTIVGTLHMMSPEMLTGKDGYSLQTDWWSVGAFLYELLTGQPAMLELFGASLDSIRPEDVNWKVDFTESYHNIFVRGGSSEKNENAKLKLATTNLIELLMDPDPSTRPAPWNGDHVLTHEAFELVGVNFSSLEAGTAPSPYTDFDRRIGHLHLLADNGSDGYSDNTEDIVSSREQKLFEGF